MRDRGQEFIVGIVFFALLGALGVITFTLGQDSFHRKEEVTFKFEEVGGLAKGSDVWINGLPSGTVEEVRLAKDGSVEATAVMRTSLAELQLKEGATVAVKSKSALGGAIISLETGKGAKVADPKAALEGLLSTTWTAAKDPFESLGNKIGGMAENLQKTLDETREGSGLLGTLIKDKKLSEDVKKIVADWKELSDLAQEGKGTIGLLFKDDALYRRAEAAVSSLEKFAESARSGEGLLGRLMNDKTLSERVDRVMKNLDELVADARAGKGTVGKLLQDQTLYDDLRATVNDFKAFAKQVNEGDGLLHELAYDSQGGKDFKATMADLRATFADIRAGKGTLGKFMQDEALYQDLRGAVRSLQRSFEEARENAPILTFAGFLFKTF